jgi:hypothetical protein
VQRYVKRFARILPVQKPGKKNQMRGAADGEKLGKSLHKCENNRLEERHAV